MAQEKPKHQIQLGGDGELLEPVEVVEQSVYGEKSPVRKVDTDDYRALLGNINYLRERSDYPTPTPAPNTDLPQTADPFVVWVMGALIIAVWVALAYAAFGRVFTPTISQRPTEQWLEWSVVATFVGWVLMLIVDVIWNQNSNYSLQLAYLQAVWGIFKGVVMVVGTLLIGFLDINSSRRRRW